MPKPNHNGAFVLYLMGSILICTGVWTAFSPFLALIVLGMLMLTVALLLYLGD